MEVSIQKTTTDKIEHRIVRQMGRAIGDFQMIANGDRILVAVSGGKDSWTLLHVLNILRKRAPVEFSLVAVNIDQGFAGFRQDTIEAYVESHGFEFHMCDFDTATLLKEKLTESDIPCSLCSRMRRGLLYGLAEHLKCTKIALGHHMDDFIETVLLNQFFVGRTAAMAPKLKSQDGRNTVIRPLVYVKEADIIEYTDRMGFPIVCCQCPLMCGQTTHLDFKRRYIKDLIQKLERDIPDVRNSLLASLSNIRPSHMLDRRLWDF